MYCSWASTGSLGIASRSFLAAVELSPGAVRTSLRFVSQGASDETGSGIGRGFTSKFWKGVEIGFGVVAGRWGEGGATGLGMGHHSNPIKRPADKSTKQNAQIRSLRFMGLVQKQID